MSDCKDAIGHPPCYLLRLPPELRNHIWDHAFHIEPAATRELFTTPDLPWHLLLTCRTIHEEATGIYESSHRTYWSDTRSEATDLIAPRALAQLCTLTERTLRHITHLTLEGPRDSRGDCDAAVYDMGLSNNHLSDYWFGPNVYVILPLAHQRSAADKAFRRSIKNDAEYGDRLGRAYLELLDYVEGSHTADMIAATAFGKTRPLRLWELEGACKYFLPDS